MRSNGSDAVEHLISETLKSSTNPLLEATNSFFNALNEQLLLDNPADGIWRTVVQPINSSNVRVDLCDTGEGYSQVLPVLVALARARADGPKILCIEQPELHLHTRAQAELARQLVTTATDKSKPQILVETHSEVLLTSIQLAIAKGEIPADLVRVYWIESSLDGTSDALPVNFNSNGQAENSTLSEAFSEAVQLSHELISMQLSALKKQ
ncbi:AAA family ATPase [Pseudomonas aeruginosa]|nr:AAA family ATPase [Pseudomonas aeruginosa]